MATAELAPRRVKEQLKRAGKVASGTAAVLGMSVLAWLTFADSKMDILGDGHTKRTADEIEILSEAKKQQLYLTSSIAGRYALLLLQPLDSYDRHKVHVGGLEGGNGLAGFLGWAQEQTFGEADHHFDYGQACLTGSAFDITPSQIRGRAEGEVSAAAALNHSDGVVTVYPAAPEAKPLRFNTGDGANFEAADDYTRNTLTAYGCDLDIRM